MKSTISRFAVIAMIFFCTPAFAGAATYQIHYDHANRTNVVMVDDDAANFVVYQYRDNGQMKYVIMRGQEFLKGDIDHSNFVDLADAILALKVLAGHNVLVIYSDTDTEVNGDAKIGIEELVYVLQAVSGLRP